MVRLLNLCWTPPPKSNELASNSAFMWRLGARSIHPWPFLQCTFVLSNRHAITEYNLTVTCSNGLNIEYCQNSEIFPLPQEEATELLLTSTACPRRTTYIPHFLLYLYI
ncbi:hypothetical protein SETIT_3G059400v2 [Setaria italica]|uniref:Uncharacterized protein n=1 Tax=Setaria italica TaxID=4555 RepID=A0A368QC77_SETIT|nr:hypothetical protein SETIT_3G059400v2 [Setaria italica]